MMFHNKKTMDDQFRIHLAKLYKRVLEDISNYSRIIYLKPRNLTENNIRFHNPNEISAIANRIYSFLQWHNIPHIIAERGDEQRLLSSLFFMNEIRKEQ